MRKIRVTIETVWDKTVVGKTSGYDRYSGLNFMMKVDSLTDFVAKQALLLTILADSGVEVEHVTAYDLHLLEPGPRLTAVTAGLELQFEDALQLFAQSLSAKTNQEKPNEDNP